jgi:predicted DNA-binding protein YlxM (UPF0122 family)
MKKSRVKATPEECAKIKDLYEAGFSMKEISDMVHWSKATVHERLRDMGVEIRPPGGSDRHPRCLSHDEIAKTVFMYENMYMTTYEIAPILGIARSTVQYRLKKAGALRPGSETLKLKNRRRNGKG